MLRHITNSRKDDDDEDDDIDDDDDDDDEQVNTSPKNTAATRNDSVHQKHPLANDTIVIDNSKSETFSPTNAYRLFNRALRRHFNVIVNQEELSSNVLKSARLVIFAAPKEPFNDKEIEVLKQFLHEQRGNILLMANEGDENRCNDHYESFLHPFGITINNDSVTRSVYFKYFHPKEVLINDAALPGSNLSHLTQKEGLHRSSVESDQSFNIKDDGVTIVYPFGCTLNLQFPACPLLTTGTLSFPANRAIAAITKTKTSSTEDSHSGGNLIVIGSAKMFNDEYIKKESNSELLNAIIKLLINDFELCQVDDDAPEYGERVEVPNTAALADVVQSCLQESDELPSDFTMLFDERMFTYDVNLIPASVRLYEQLNVPHLPLSLIAPQFNVPQPPLQPATFVPSMRELAAPPLPLFDLDEQFATQRCRLAELANKCDEKDIDFFIREAGEICGVSDEQTRTSDEPTKAILTFVAAKLLKYRQMEQ